MDILSVVILGIVQGLTEFLPISSSGHLVICEHMLGLSYPGMSLEIWLHFGTLLSVLVYFRRRLLELAGSILPGAPKSETTANRKMLLALVVGTLPAVVIGLSFRSSFEAAFDSPRFASAMLVVTGIILLSTRLAGISGRYVTIPRGFWIGWAQAVAILPGISRSGSTISAALFLGIRPALAAEFSFLLAIPAIGGAFLLDIFSSGGIAFTPGEMGMLLVGTTTAFVFGVAAIYSLLKIIGRGKFFLFGFYCLVAGTVSLIFMS